MPGLPPGGEDRWKAVDGYITDLLVETDPSLEAALRASAEAGLPPHNVSPAQGQLLRLLARAQGARTILEIGTLGGYSTIWLAGGLPAGGCLLTLEGDPEHARVACANFAHAGLSEIVELHLGPALDTLRSLAGEGRGPFDLIFIDADKPAYPEYLLWVLRLSRPGSLIIADNVVRAGEVADADSDDPSVRGARRFNALLAEEPGVSATVIQTVGAKGYDGFALALVTGDQ